jgi:hypothetical protein
MSTIVYDYDHWLMNKWAQEEEEQEEESKLKATCNCMHCKQARRKKQLERLGELRDRIIQRRSGVIRQIF